MASPSQSGRNSPKVFDVKKGAKILWENISEPMVFGVLRIVN